MKLNGELQSKGIEYFSWIGYLFVFITLWTYVRELQKDTNVATETKRSTSLNSTEMFTKVWKLLFCEMKEQS